MKNKLICVNGILKLDLSYNSNICRKSSSHAAIDS